MNILCTGLVWLTTSFVLATIFSFRPAAAQTCTLTFDSVVCTYDNNGTPTPCSDYIPPESCDPAGTMDLTIQAILIHSGDTSNIVQETNLSQGTVTTVPSSTQFINPSQFEGPQTIQFGAQVASACGIENVQVQLQVALYDLNGPAIPIAGLCPTPDATNGIGVFTVGSSSSESGGGGKRRRRRLVAATNIVLPQDDAYQDHLKTCGHELYGVSIYVDSAPHLYAIATPQTNAKCPHVATHAITNNGGSFIKEILTWDNKADFDAMFDRDNSVFVGVFTLAELEQAFQNTNAGEKYNVVTNNCGTYLVKLGSHLGVKVNHDIVSHVTRRLIEYSTSDFLKSIHSSIGSLWDHSLRVTEKHAIDILVKESVSDLL